MSPVLDDVVEQRLDMDGCGLLTLCPLLGMNSCEDAACDEQQSE
jgi:hypothetical protein